MSKHFQPDTVWEPHIAAIAEAVSDVTGVPLSEIKGESRLQEVAWARHAVCYLARRNTQATQRAIGAYLGGRDHSTVRHGHERIAAHRSVYADLDLVLADLEAYITRREDDE